MTREEALTILKQTKEVVCDYHQKAFDMAIKSLEQEPCEDCISRKYLLSIANDDGAYGYVSIHDIINAPSVTPKEPKTGHWISHYDEDEKVGWYECDCCHTERAFNTRFCPDCGTKMESSDVMSELIKKAADYFIDEFVKEESKEE